MNKGSSSKNKILCDHIGFEDPLGARTPRSSIPFGYVPSKYFTQQTLKALSSASAILLSFTMIFCLALHKAFAGPEEICSDLTEENGALPEWVGDLHPLERGLYDRLTRLHTLLKTKPGAAHIFNSLKDEGPNPFPDAVIRPLSENFEFSEPPLRQKWAFVIPVNEDTQKHSTRFLPGPILVSDAIGDSDTHRSFGLNQVHSAGEIQFFRPNRNDQRILNLNISIQSGTFRPHYSTTPLIALNILKDRLPINEVFIFMQTSHFGSAVTLLEVNFNTGRIGGALSGHLKTD